MMISASTANSILGNNNNVIINVVRNGYISSTIIVNGDSSNSFKRSTWGTWVRRVNCP